MKIKPFATEEFFADYEFSAPYMLSASDCESMTIEALMQCAGVGLDGLGACSLQYTESQGGRVVREAIASTYDAVSADDVIMLNAPQEGIYLAMNALLEPRDRVLVLTPCYDSLVQVAEHIGCEMHRLHLIADHHAGVWVFDMAQLEERLRTLKPRMVIVNFPHNPTGYLPGVDEWEEMQSLVTRHGALLFSDEMYRGLELGGRSMLSSGGEHHSGRVITLGGLSKSHGLPGLRSGWLVIKDQRLREQVLAWKHYTSICAPAPVEYLTSIAVQVQERLFEANRALIEGNAAYVEEGLQDDAMNGFRWIMPLAGSTALLFSPWQDVEAKAHELAREHGVVVLPAKFLGADAGAVRLGLGRAGFKEAWDKFIEVMKS